MVSVTMIGNEIICIDWSLYSTILHYYICFIFVAPVTCLYVCVLIHIHSYFYTCSS